MNNIFQSFKSIFKSSLGNRPPEKLQVNSSSANVLTDIIPSYNSLFVDSRDSSDFSASSTTATASVDNYPFIPISNMNLSRATTTGKTSTSTENTLNDFDTEESKSRNRITRIFSSIPTDSQPKIKLGLNEFSSDILFVPHSNGHLQNLSFDPFTQTKLIYSNTYTKRQIYEGKNIQDAKQIVIKSIDPVDGEDDIDLAEIATHFYLYRKNINVDNDNDNDHWSNYIAPVYDVIYSRKGRTNIILEPAVSDMNKFFFLGVSEGDQEHEPKESNESNQSNESNESKGEEEHEFAQLRKSNYKTRLEYSYQMGLCVFYTHLSGFAHLDLKSANFLFFSDYTVRLTDFGLAMPVFMNNDLKSSCFSSIRPPNVVTYPWRPPELQYRTTPEDEEKNNGVGIPFLPFAVDVWSFGIILGETLLNHRVFSNFIQGQYKFFHWIQYLVDHMNNTNNSNNSNNTNNTNNMDKKDDNNTMNNEINIKLLEGIQNEFYEYPIQEIFDEYFEAVDMTLEDVYKLYLGDHLDQDIEIEMRAKSKTKDKEQDEQKDFTPSGRQCVKMAQEKIYQTLNISDKTMGPDIYLLREKVYRKYLWNNLPISEIQIKLYGRIMYLFPIEKLLIAHQTYGFALFMEIIELISSCLTFDPSKRISMMQVMISPVWQKFSYRSSPLTSDLAQDINMKNIINFHTLHKRVPLPIETERLLWSWPEEAMDYFDTFFNYTTQHQHQNQNRNQRYSDDINMWENIITLNCSIMHKLKLKLGETSEEFEDYSNHHNIKCEAVFEICYDLMRIYFPVLRRASERKIINKLKKEVSNLIGPHLWEGFWISPDPLPYS